MTLALRYLAHSEIGLVRKNNQDSAYVSPTMLAVADGMGGAAAGDLASAIAVDQLAKADSEHPGGEDMLSAMTTAISDASDLINELVDTDPSLDGMGSTACVLMFDGEQLALANIGDSRAYRYRDRELTRLSRDHSWVQSLIDEGKITEAEALEHPHRSLILKVINGQPQHTPDVALLDVQVGDRLLLCSDGLCGLVTDDVIAARISGERQDVMDAMIRVAHLEGGLDNITIIIADVVDGEAEGEPQILGAAELIDVANFNAESTLVQKVADQVPTIQAAPVEGEVARYSPTTKRHGFAWLKILAAVLVPILVIGGSGFLWYSYTQEQYYVGPHDQYLGIYQGIPEPTFGLPLSHLVQPDATLISDLPIYYQEQVQQTIPASSLDGARATLVMLQEKAAECVQIRNSATASPSPSPSISPTGPTSTASAEVSADPSPTATPTASVDC
ncbi:MAG TPA: protein phosphatase 2C domain-containing protein [Propionicimonas sp.]|nr:protein phosphatase 2C domain-containing protein [Propionicimonas sp.]